MMRVSLEGPNDGEKRTFAVDVAATSSTVGSKGVWW
jgi:hypothetical protein